MALCRLHAGNIVGIFPEGGIHIGPGLGEFNPGVAWLALRGKVPVYPVIGGTLRIKIRSCRASCSASRPTRCSARRSTSRAWKGARPTQAVMQEVTDYLRNILLEMKASLPMPPIPPRIAVQTCRQESGTCCQANGTAFTTGQPLSTASAIRPFATRARNPEETGFPWKRCQPRAGSLRESPSGPRIR